MPIDPNTPILVGSGQVNGRTLECSEPMDLVERALELALKDCGAPAFHNGVDFIAVTRMGTGRYQNPAGALRERRKLPKARTLVSEFGGHTAQLLLANIAEVIRRGECEAAIIAGGELGGKLRMGESAPVTDGAASEPDAVIGEEITQWITHPAEAALGIHLPVQVYPLLETAMAWRHGRSISDHMQHVAALWARFSEAACANPNANDRALHSAAEIGTQSASNRFIGYPYTKLMNSDPFVDQAAAILMCSAGRAEALGIPRDRWIFPWAAAEARSGYVVERRDLSAAPALRRAAGALTNVTGVAPADMDLLDLYACFPFAVEVQAEALGLSLERPLTVTGGMRFAGGPWNTYTLHMLANLVQRLRGLPNGRALCSGNGGYATRFSLGMYGTVPPPQGFHRLAELSGPIPDEAIEVEDSLGGDVRLEAFCVEHDKSGAPARAIMLGRTEADRRAIAVSKEKGVMEDLLSLQHPTTFKKGSSPFDEH